MRELDAFREECVAIDATLRGVPRDAWEQPGALGTWNLAQLVAHLTRGAGRIAAYLPQPVQAPAQWDRVTYWHDVGDIAADVARRAIEEARDVAPAALPQRFAEAWRASAETAGRESADRVMATVKGPMRLDDYLSTRVLEMVVHHTDVCRALGRPPVSTPAAAQITVEVLEGLLGEPKPRNLGRARFIAVATGRMASDDPRFPVLS